MADDVKDDKETPHPFQAEVDAANAARTGKGTRLFCGNTRGKGSIPIKWEKFDESKPDTLPADVKEFVSLVGPFTDKQILDMLIVGYNDDMYTAASDPIAEYVNASWDKDTQAQFRLVVRNYSKATGDSIEKAVNLIKPGVEAAFSAKQK